MQIEELTRTRISRSILSFYVYNFSRSLYNNTNILRTHQPLSLDGHTLLLLVKMMHWICLDVYTVWYKWLWLCKIPLFVLFYNTRFSYSRPKPEMWSCTLSPPPNLRYSTFHAFLANEAQPLAKIPNHVQNSNCRSKDI